MSKSKKKKNFLKKMNELNRKKVSNKNSSKNSPIDYLDIDSKEFIEEGRELRRQIKEQNQKGFLLTKELIGNIPDLSERNKMISQELHEDAMKCNLYREILGINQSQSKDNFNKLRLRLFIQVAKIIEYGDNTPKEVIEEIKNVGLELYNNGGMNDMSDPLIWSFIPKSLHGEMEYYFDGIGEWRA